MEVGLWLPIATRGHEQACRQSQTTVEHWCWGSQEGLSGGDPPSHGMAIFSSPVLSQDKVGGWSRTGGLSGWSRLARRLVG